MRTQSAVMRAATLALLALLAVGLLATGARAADSCGDDAQSAASAEGMCTAPPEVTQHAAASFVPTTVAAAIAASTSPTLQRVQSRGQLSCALVEFTLGHAKVDSPSVASGMEPELCKGLSAALGLGTSPYYHAMKAPGERFPLLQAGSVDVVFALTSKTAQRDMVEHGSFSIPYFQDQHNLMYPSTSGISSAASLSGKTICATAGTTNPNVLGDYLASIAAELTEPVKMHLVDEDAEALRMMARGECHAFVNDHSVVAGYVHSEPQPAEGATFQLADFPGTPFARAPFSAVTLDGDTEWASIVDWYVNGLFLAEMYGVTAANVDERAADPTLPGEAQRLLGVQLVGGRAFPFDMRAAIKTIGNYAELYERNFGAFLPRTRANQLYQDGGAVFPGGFR